VAIRLPRLLVDFALLRQPPEQAERGVELTVVSWSLAARRLAGVGDRCTHRRIHLKQVGQLGDQLFSEGRELDVKFLRSPFQDFECGVALSL
jgi:hypothetical protein